MNTDTDTKPVAEANGAYASFIRRCGAFFIDVTLLSLVIWGLSNILTELSAFSGLSIFYFIGLWTWKGQTLGQMAFNIKVVRADGKPVDMGTSFMRCLGYILCMLTLGIGFLITAFDHDKQGLHDRMAETYVVRCGSKVQDIPPAVEAGRQI